MRLVVFITVIASFGVLLLFGFLQLVRELFGKDFFEAPSISADPANRVHDMNRDRPSHSANLTS
jgi:hypothetical protein